MRVMKKMIYAALCIVGILSFSCEKEKIETDSKKAILGKWEIVGKGNWPNMESIIATGYTEYTPDSIIRFYDYELMQFTAPGKYWIEDSTLLISTLSEDGFEVVFEYKYDFFDNNNKLLLDVYAFMMFNTSIYKRLR